MATIDTLKHLAAEHFGRNRDDIDEDKPIDQLAIDSLGFLEFLFELEDKLGVSIPTPSVQGVRTLRELGAAIGLGEELSVVIDPAVRGHGIVGVT